VATTNSSQSAIANVLDIKQTPDPQIVQVKYNSLVPETMQGSLNDPQIRQLVMLATKMPASPEVHKDAVSLLVNQCRATSGCGDDSSTGPGTYQGTLLASLHYDNDPQVRLNALQGLQPYVAQSESVRNAVLDVLMNDQSPDVRSLAISMLEPVQADSSVRRVLRSVSTQDSNPAIRNASYQALQGSADIE
jgi:HEAT repeats